jgi:hypothetical protein
VAAPALGIVILALGVRLAGAIDAGTRDRLLQLRAALPGPAAGPFGALVTALSPPGARA